MSPAVAGLRNGPTPPSPRDSPLAHVDPPLFWYTLGKLIKFTHYKELDSYISYKSLNYVQDLAKNIIIHNTKKSIQLSNFEFSLLAVNTLEAITWLIWKFEEEQNEEVFQLPC